MHIYVCMYACTYVCIYIYQVNPAWLLTSRVRIGSIAMAPPSEMAKSTPIAGSGLRGAGVRAGVSRSFARVNPMLVTQPDPRARVGDSAPVRVRGAARAVRA